MFCEAFGGFHLFQPSEHTVTVGCNEFSPPGGRGGGGRDRAPPVAALRSVSPPRVVVVADRA